MIKKSMLIAVAVAFLAGVIVSAVYFYFGPSTGPSAIRQPLGGDIGTKQAPESKAQEEIARLKATLEETEAQLAKKTASVEDLQTKMEALRQEIASNKTRKETVVAAADRRRQGVRESRREAETPAEGLAHPSGRAMRTVATGESVPAEADRAMINRSAIALEVKDREPVGICERVSIDQQRVYCWMQVLNGQGGELTVRWMSKGQKIGEAHLPVGSNSWRTWSYITLSPRMIGPAQVQIIDENARVLKTLSFEIIA